ncbi:YutD family protein [Cohnella sp.]|uniref:YutD family protein n=1 Tax=Cohnella sp. TaxID=1883426 RepID=UPI003562C06C
MIFMAGGNAYSLFHEHKSGWNPEAFRERFSEVLERFDYIVGDWGYNQLRLRGFYKDGHPRATKESAISSFVDYINEYCNFGCAYFVLNKLDSSTLPPEALIMKEETPEAIVAMNETGEQVAETAATAAPPITPVIINGQIMRWPIKERAGGPVRAPNVTVSAVARAAADAERRNASANVNQNFPSGSSSQARGSQSRQGQDSGNANRQGRSYSGPSGGGDRRQQSQGQGGPSAKPYPPRSPRPQGNEQAIRSIEETQTSEHGSLHTDHSHNDAARNDNRWSSKNRRRKSFGGKPNYRPDGAPRSDIGNPRSGE